jgi:hypothetical protein
MTGRIRERQKLDVRNLTAKEAATILQRRCAITTASGGFETERKRLTERGEIRVTPLQKFGDDGFSFDIDEESSFEFRGRKRREILWSVTVYVDASHDGGLDIGIYEDKNLEPMPEEILRCAMDAIASADLKLIR